MTNEHTISATAVTATSTIALEVREAEITLDDTWCPYGVADLTCAMPDPADVELIDPREGVRVSITLTRDVGDQSRTFDLLLTDRTTDPERDTLYLTAATDEAALQTAARVATDVDTSARELQTSLRSIINTLVVPTIGASLEVDTGADWDATIDTDATNHAPQPVPGSAWDAHTRLAASTLAGGAVDGFRPAMRTTRVSTGPTALYFHDGDPVPVSVGETYTVAYYVRPSFELTEALLRVHDGATSGSAGVQHTSDQPLAAGEWARHTFTFVASTPTVRFSMYWETGTVGTTVDFCNLMLTESDQLLEYFDGDTPDSDLYAYSWQASAGASPSTRVGLMGRDEGMLDWEPGVTAWDFVAPLVQAAGLRLYCDEQRLWHLVDPAAPLDGLVNVSEGANLTDGRDTISRSRDWFDAVVIEYAWTDATGTPRKAWDAADDGDPTNTLTLRHDRPYPGPGAARAVLTRAKGRGRVLDISALSNYNATPGVALQASLPGAPTQTGYISATTWTFPDDEMTIKSRGLVDTPPTAWVFLDVDEAWTDSPIGESWLDETI